MKNCLRCVNCIDVRRCNANCSTTSCKTCAVTFECSAAVETTVALIAVSSSRQRPRFCLPSGPKSTQEEAYEDTKPLVTSCADGYNVCILAYGQTGSGKTYTMQGPPNDPGVNVRALTDLLDICKDRDNIQYTLKASTVEIYNESIHDLLSSKLTSLEIRDQGTKITLPGMTRAVSRERTGHRRDYQTRRQEQTCSIHQNE